MIHKNESCWSQCAEKSRWRGNACLLLFLALAYSGVASGQEADLTAPPRIAEVESRIANLGSLSASPQVRATSEKSHRRALEALRTTNSWVESDYGRQR